MNAMNEIWVPSQWQLESFAASGVTREKLVVVPEVRTVRQGGESPSIRSREGGEIW